MFGKRYHDVITDTQWNADYANGLKDKMITMRANLERQRTDLLHALVYEVATAHQRKPLLTCIKHMKIKKMKKKLEKMHGHPL